MVHCSLDCIRFCYVVSYVVLKKNKTTWKTTWTIFYVVLRHIFIIKLKKDYIEYLNSKNFKDIDILDYMDIIINRVQLDQSNNIFLWPKN